MRSTEKHGTVAYKGGPRKGKYLGIQFDDNVPPGVTSIDPKIVKHERPVA